MSTPIRPWSYGPNVDNPPTVEAYALAGIQHYVGFIEGLHTALELRSVDENYKLQNDKHQNLLFLEKWLAEAKARGMESLPYNEYKASEYSTETAT